MVKRARTRSKGRPSAPRRSAGEARDAILEAAQRRIAALGPAALRLSDVAADAGITHPAVLHHFGSRGGLVAEVARRAIETLERELLSLLETPGVPPEALLERAFERLARADHGRLVAWLLLSEDEAATAALARTQRLTEIAAAVHGRRLAEAAGAPISLEDSLFGVLLVVLVTLGSAVVGERIVTRAGLGDPAALRLRFQRWLKGLLADRFAPPSQG